MERKLQGTGWMLVRAEIGMLAGQRQTEVVRRAICRALAAEQGACSSDRGWRAAKSSKPVGWRMMTWTMLCQSSRYRIRAVYAHNYLSC